MYLRVILYSKFSHKLNSELDSKFNLELIAIGIFPEGGSHDRTDLLPLKPGVAFIAYSALERDHFNIPIVPVGLNYFRGHRFRGRVIVEYGRPTFIDPKTMASYNKGGSEKRKVCSEFLDR